MVDYSKYTLPELHEALASIDAEKYPGNYQKLIAELNKPERKESRIVFESTEVQEKRNELKSFKLTIVIGIFFVFWSYLAYNKGVIYQRCSDEILASIDNNPESFFFILSCGALLGACLIVFGLFKVYKLSKQEKD